MFKSRPARVSVSLALMAPLLLLAGCNKNPLQVTRSLCPAVAIPQYTGDTTLFAPANSRDASAIDVTATIINLRGTCTESPEQLGTVVNFDVVAQRRDAGPARTVIFPYFIAMVQGGNDGRDHHNRGFTMWLAGGGVKAGGHAIFLSTKDSQLGRGEPVEDAARCIASARREESGKVTLSAERDWYLRGGRITLDDTTVTFCDELDQTKTRRTAVGRGER